MDGRFAAVETLAAGSLRARHTQQPRAIVLTKGTACARGCGWVCVLWLVLLVLRLAVNRAGLDVGSDLAMQIMVASCRNANFRLIRNARLRSC